MNIIKYNMKLTQQDMARLLRITPMTLRNWRKDKPYLYEIVIKGFTFDELVQQSKKNHDELIKLQESFKA